MLISAGLCRGAKKPVQGSGETLHNMEKSRSAKRDQPDAASEASGIELPSGEFALHAGLTDSPHPASPDPDERRSRLAQLAILNALPAEIAVLSSAGVILTTNDSWKRDFGAGVLCGPAFPPGANYLNLLREFRGASAEHAQAIAAGLQSVIAREASQFIREYPVFQEPERLPRWFRTLSQPMHSAADGAVMFLQFEVTDRILNQQALEASEQSYRHIVEMYPDLIFVNRGGKIDYINPAGLRLLGAERAEQVLGRSPFEFFHPDDHPEIQRRINRLLERPCSVPTVQLRLVTLNGETLEIESTGASYQSRDQLVIQVVCRNISEQTRTANLLREQAALLDTTRDAIIVRDLDQIILYWNKGAERMYGWTADEALGRYSSELLYSDLSEFSAACAELLRTGAWNGELKQKKRDGTPLIVECRWSVALDAQGAPRRILAINTDVTERRGLEQQFLRAQRLESIGTLAGGIAHDLNNILTPIILSLDLLKRLVRDEHAQTLLDVVAENARRGADMVSQVLLFARGQETGRRIPVSLENIVQEIERIVRDAFPKSIAFFKSTPADLWPVIGDPTQLHQVLLNLCVNARDAMASGGNLAIRAENLMIDKNYAAMNLKLQPGPYVAVAVEDSGAGMTPEILDRIFEPFFTTKETGVGTGLGLSTSLAIIKAHGGDIRVYSEPNTGATFRIYLPAALNAATVEPDRSAPATPRGAGQLILVVDDEAAIREITRQTLESYGYRAIVASDGAEAISMYAQRSMEIELVITDMMMAIMDGPAAIRVLRRMNPNIRIIAASGISANGGAARLSELKIKYFLAKPYTAEALLQMVQRALDDADD